MSLLALHRADLGYAADSPVLRQVELAVDRGEFLVLAGANGSGKSTLMRSLLGGLPLLAGERRATECLRMAYVPQSLQLDPEFPVTVEDVVAMGLWVPGAKPDRAERVAKVAAALEQVEMGGRGRVRFGRLSGGQKQRVLLARALVREAGLLLLDEPVSGVDARATRIILGILDAEVQAGKAVVLVSHRPSALEGLATHGLLVKHGGVEAVAVERLCSGEGLELLWAT